MSFRAVVLAGGRGTRLAPYTHVLPKPLLPVGERPILDLVLSKLARAGCSKVTLSIGYLGHLIETFCGSGEPWGVEIDYLRERKPLGTVGAISLMDDLPAGPFLVMNGDVLTDASFNELLEFHATASAQLTIGSYRRTVREEFGVLEVGADGRLTGYREKPENEYLVSMGVYVFSPDCVDYIPRGHRMDLPDLVQRILDDGEPVQSWIHTGSWLDIGRHDDFERANEELRGGSFAEPDQGRP